MSVRCIQRTSALIALALAACRAPSVSYERAPLLPGAQPVLVEGYRAFDPLSLHATLLVRAELARRVSPQKVYVIPERVVDATLENASQPSRLSLDDVRELAKSIRAATVIDLWASANDSGVVLSAWRIRPPATGELEALPPVTARTLERAATILARQPAADSTLAPPSRPRAID